jgi:hypothetical protein
LTKLREHRATIAAQRALLAGYISLVPALCFAQVNVQSAASQILQVISLAFAAIAGIGIVFCCVAGVFGFAQWTKLLNIMGWTAAGGGGLALATYGVSLAV